MEIAQGRRRRDGTPKIPTDPVTNMLDTVSWNDTCWHRMVNNFFLREINAHRTLRSNLGRGSVSAMRMLRLDEIWYADAFSLQMETDDIGHNTDHLDLSPTAPYEPKGLPSQLAPPPPSECQISSGFMGGFAEQYWEDHLRQPAEGTVPRNTPARLQDLAETWYAETLSMQRGP